MSAATIDPATLGRGFANLVLDAQASFREILRALARPGEIRHLDADVDAPHGLDSATAILLLTLADGDTPVWLPSAARSGEAGAYVRFYAGAPLASTPEQAAFGVHLGRADEPRLGAFHPGEDRYPDRSATLFVQVASLEGGAPVRLSGPGIETSRIIEPAGVPAHFWSDWAENRAGYPLGVDVILASGRDILGLPRSVLAEPVRSSPCT